MHRFFINTEQIQGNTIEILDKDVKHIKDVLRLKVNDKIEVVSNGHIYISKILEVNANSIIVKVVEDYLGKNEAPVDIVLYQGIAKGDKMDYIFQKGVEVGIVEFYPVIMDRTVVKIKNRKKEENRLRRWNGIVEEAAKQSKRDILPVVQNIINFNEMIDILQDEENILVPYEEEKSRSLREIFREEKRGKIHIIIGPEGGFEPYEIDSLEKIGGEIVSLGPRILRTETAGLVAATVVLYEFGALGGIK
mgnify:CR=1 FL=1